LADALSKEADGLREEMKKTHRLYLDDELSPKGFGALYRPLEERLGQLEAELPSVQGEADFLAVQLLSNEEMFSDARDLYARWDTLAFDEKRAIVESLVSRITVGRDAVTIDLASPPASLGNRSTLATNQQGFVAQIPLRFIAPAPKPRYPKQFKHLGDHLRARRIGLGLLQKDAAPRMGVHTATVTNWELGNTEPEERFIPALIGFLGYNPLPASRSPGEAIRRERLTRGWSLATLAAKAGVDAATVARLEMNTKGMAMRSVRAVQAAIGPNTGCTADPPHRERSARVANPVEAPGFPEKARLSAGMVLPELGIETPQTDT
jgi:transcriptional regulator with XRE-family HTH domain